MKDRLSAQKIVFSSKLAVTDSTESLTTEIS
jgi:hypothetical protein